MRKPRLMTPGPASVPEDVLLELARPVIHHRSAEAKAVITEVAAGLKEVFQTANDVLILTSSGTGAMEPAAVNAVPPGGKALVLNAGHFAARWGEICKAFGIDAVMLDTEWGQPVDASRPGVRVDQPESLGPDRRLRVEELLLQPEVGPEEDEGVRHAVHPGTHP